MNNETGTPELWNWVLTGITSILGGLFLYNNKKINDMPEKYLMKDDYHRAQTNLREDMSRNKDELLAAIKALSERLDRRRATDCDN